MLFGPLLALLSKGDYFEEWLINKHEFLQWRELEHSGFHPGNRMKSFFTTLHHNYFHPSAMLDAAAPNKEAELNKLGTFFFLFNKFLWAANKFAIKRSMSACLPHFGY